MYVNKCLSKYLRAYVNESVFMFVTCCFHGLVFFFLSFIVHLWWCLARDASRFPSDTYINKCVGKYLRAYVNEKVFTPVT